MSDIAFSKLNALSTDALRELNRQVVALINHRLSAQQFEKLQKFRVGQTVTFYASKKDRHITLRITRLNTKSVSGVELDATGNETFSTWRVAPSLLKAV